MKKLIVVLFIVGVTFCFMGKSSYSQNTTNNTIANTAPDFNIKNIEYLEKKYENLLQELQNLQQPQKVVVSKNINKKKYTRNTTKPNKYYPNPSASPSVKPLPSSASPSNITSLNSSVSPSPAPIRTPNIDTASPEPFIQNNKFIDTIWQIFFIILGISLFIVMVILIIVISSRYIKHNKDELLLLQQNLLELENEYDIQSERFKDTKYFHLLTQLISTTQRLPFRFQLEILKIIIKLQKSSFKLYNNIKEGKNKLKKIQIESNNLQQNLNNQIKENMALKAEFEICSKELKAKTQELKEIKRNLNSKINQNNEIKKYLVQLNEGDINQLFFQLEEIKDVFSQLESQIKDLIEFEE